MACRKAEGLLAAEAQVRVISPVIAAGLKILVDSGEVDWQEKVYEQGDLRGAFLIFAATDRPEIQQAVALEAQNAGQLINVIDAPGDCDFQVPASVRRGDLLISVSTNGKSPAVAAMIKKKLERDFGPEYQDLLLLMASIRTRVMAGNDSFLEKKLLFENVLDEDIIDWLKSGQWEALEKHLQAVLGVDNVPEISLMRAEKK